MEDFKLGSEAHANGTKAVRALHAFSSSLSTALAPPGEPLYLIIDVTHPLVTLKDYIPRIIPVPHPLGSLDNSSVLLITKDPSTPYRRALSDPRAPTATVFNNICTLTKVRALVKDTNKAKKLFKENDLVVADVRVHKFLPGILGARFYIKNKKIPYMIQMARPRHDAELVKGKHLQKLKDERCEPKYVYKQLQHIARGATFIPPANGTCLSIKIGFSGWPVENVMENINTVITYLTDEKHRPVGGIIREMSHIKSVHLKTSGSASMPLIASSLLKKEEEEIDSDFDF